MDWKRVISEIESDENKQRKAEHLKRFRVYNDYQREYILKMLTEEFSPQTVREMRTCTSINLTRKIVDEMASIYKRKPERDFSEVTDKQHEAIEAIYQSSKVDTILKRANQKYKLHEQCALQVIPKAGEIALRLLAPHQYDVVPTADDPETAYAYIISSFDKTMSDNAIEAKQDVQGNYYGSKNQQASDKTNQTIADEDDWKTNKTYIVWTANETIKLDRNGNVIESSPNPIGKLPFIDISADKDFEFWVRRGASVVEFNLDFGVVLSDTVNTNRLQSYAQPVITAEKLPESVTVGPQHILWLPLDPTRPESKPSFDFASPNPDLKSSLDLLDRLVSYFLSANNVSIKSITGDGQQDKYSSGLERLLAMIERFEASQSDIDLFIAVEEKLYDLMRSWYNIIKDTELLKPKLAFGEWPESSEITVKFCGPEIVQTEADKEDSVIKLLEAGLITKKEAIIKLRNVTDEEADDILETIDEPINTEA